ncbi:uncharacterized protein LOC115758469 [Drosophila novamexicana]|uniref:uncharacterized protein LOC115758469 n=1 Tax=Drosophila novamexicana TaxID=47314 RepID=UPI0011E5D712|nr:uncharacterized protein LOC115758469 [Drosophila novamexicana]XP_030555004.1 uncharacterized protein LOC115758469 [Drosophila novamexicana]XP_030555005.1 uncharacterized protein LOC115758469 [Drosophila novamexicana]
MSTAIKALALLLMLMQCIRGESLLPMQQLLRLDNIVTDRINGMLKQYEHLRNQTENEEFLRQYERLEMAAALPIAQLDEKIKAYNEYLAYDLLSRALELAGSSTDSSSDQDLLRDTNVDGTRAKSYNAFEKRVLKLLRKLGVYDSFTERVFKAIFSDEKQLKKLKKKLKELDDDDNDNDCCLWDFIFGLF